MQISEQKVVTMNYEVVDSQGQLIDRSEEGGPLAYIHGTGQLIPGLETALEGRGKGDKVAVDVAPEQGYGKRDEEGVQTVTRNQFDDSVEIKVDMQFEAQDDDEGHQIVTVVAVDGENITLDTNHPLAGKALHFEVEILEVRDASAEELSHGHVHGPGGHDH
ncbi:MAG TPA: peptidylprolyl isomerase [Candidatus Latescibacteria bacterium]|nr:peptidylprolyl isomerase [Candidatus Handelsmanbacteria bacterium]HIL11883.1 peptidylprolyl isomerase [Candidatus Latescibacterota bacterium]